MKAREKRRDLRDTEENALRTNATKVIMINFELEENFR
jgi:hypothetical protein